VTLGLLLGGAIGNMLDRLRLGYVVDFVDAGLGATRFYTFNVADSAISVAILLLLVAAFRPSLVEADDRRAIGADASPELRGREPDADDDWGDGLAPDDGSPSDRSER
jgi:hypothetical protein